MFASLLSAQKPKLAYNNVIGEIVVRIPEIDEFGEVVEDGPFTNVVFVCPVVITVHELRRRISGEIGFPIKMLHLYYKGSLLADDEVVSAEVYENLDGLEYDSDEEFYKPRICLQIYMIEEIEFDDDGNEIDPNAPQDIEPVTDIGIDVDQGQEDSEEGVSEEGEDDDVLRALVTGSSKELIELDAQQEEAYNLQTKIFNLKDELEKINCSKYYDSLLEQGYGDLGAFCFLTEEALAGKGIWASRVARSRMLALADTMKRKHKQLRDGTANRKKKRGESGAGFTIDGLDETFTTKAAMKKAWAVSKSRSGTPAHAKSNTTTPSRLPSRADDSLLGASVFWPPSIDLPVDDLSSLGGSVFPGADMTSYSVPCTPPVSVVPRPPDKILSKEANDLIAEIARIGHRDTFDCLTDASLMSEYPVVERAPLKWCCESHRLEHVYTTQVLEETKLDCAISEVNSAIEKADVAGGRILPRSTLRCIVNTQMLKRNIAYPSDLVEKLLDASIADWSEVVVTKEWGRVGDNAVKYDGIPHMSYSINKFSRLLAEKLCDGDTIKTYLMREKVYKCPDDSSNLNTRSLESR